jgi:hypothetical protein
MPLLHVEIPKVVLTTITNGSNLSLDRLEKFLGILKVHGVHVPRKNHRLETLKFEKVIVLLF